MQASKQESLSAFAKTRLIKQITYFSKGNFQNSFKPKKIQRSNYQPAPNFQERPNFQESLPNDENIIKSHMYKPPEQPVRLKPSSKDQLAEGKSKSN